MFLSCSPQSVIGQVQTFYFVIFSGGPFTYTQFTLDPCLLISKKRNHLKSVYQTVIPGSPMARRTKHEIKSAQKLAK